MENGKQQECRGRGKGKTDQAGSPSEKKSKVRGKMRVQDGKKNNGLESWEGREHRRWLKQRHRRRKGRGGTMYEPLWPQTSSCSSLSVVSSHTMSGKRSFAERKRERKFACQTAVDALAAS